MSFASGDVTWRWGVIHIVGLFVLSSGQDSDLSRQTQWDIAPGDCKVPTEGGNPGDGALCVFPFVYGGVPYPSCISLFRDQFWCGTTSDVDSDERWGQCIIFTLNGTRCNFPFVSGGRTYTGCTAEAPYGGGMDNPTWCATVADLDAEPGNWGPCDLRGVCVPESATQDNSVTIANNFNIAQGCYIPTSGGTGGGARCADRWTYQGTEYTGCISVIRDGRWWCGTSETVDADTEWGLCQIYTTSGEACIFPFNAGSIIYGTCTTDTYNGINTANEGLSWCAVVPHLDSMPTRWGYCDLGGVCDASAATAVAVTSVSDVTDTTGAGGLNVPEGCYIETSGGTGEGALCAASWTYQGVQYTGCISQFRDGLLWCGTSETVDADTLWGYCKIYTVDGEVCVFPFNWGTEIYGTCVTLDNQAGPQTQPWCATVNHLTSMPDKWGYCDFGGICPSSVSQVSVTDSQSVTTQDAGDASVGAGGCVRLPVLTETGAACVFPWTYQGEPQNTCITNNYDRPWCGTTAEYDTDQQWGTCIIYTTAGVRCVFPFFYNTGFHHTCTVDGGVSGIPYCATVDILAADDQDNWGYCDLYPVECDNTTTSEAPLTSPGTALDVTTVGVTAVVETTSETTGTTPIPLETSPETTTAVAAETTGIEATLPGNCERLPVMTDMGVACVFPWTYQGEPQNTCIINNWNRPWCGTTAEYDTDQQWASCIIYTTTGVQCNFPFTYAGVDYFECTTGGGFSGIPYCATVANLEANDNNNWGYCDLYPFTCTTSSDVTTASEVMNTGSVTVGTDDVTSDAITQEQTGTADVTSATDGVTEGMSSTDCQPLPIWTEMGLPCVFPWQHQGVPRDACITDNWDRPWCAVTRDYDTNQEWGNCILLTTDGRRCQFPFTYDGVEYRECTTEGGTSGIPYCSTIPALAVDNDVDWGYCDLNPEICVTTSTSDDVTSSGVTTASSVTSASPSETEASTITGTAITTALIQTTDNTAVDTDTASMQSTAASSSSSSGSTNTMSASSEPSTGDVTVTSSTGCREGDCTTTEATEATATTPCPDGICPTTMATMPSMPSANCFVTTSGGTGGPVCVFPFLYFNNIEITSCTAVNHNRLWCATTYNYVEERLWGNCEEIICPNTPSTLALSSSTETTLSSIDSSVASQSPTIATSTELTDVQWDSSTSYTPGSTSVPSLTTDGVSQSTMHSDSSTSATSSGTASSASMETTSEFSNTSPVSTTGTMDASTLSQFCYTTTSGGTGLGLPCMFPFTYQGMTYTSCITVAWPQPWCMVTISGLWGNCGEVICPITPSMAPTTERLMTPTAPADLVSSCYIPTMGGNGMEENCTLPFVYVGRVYFNCTTDGDRMSWCSVTTNYDVDRLYGYCLDEICISDEPESSSSASTSASVSVSQTSASLSSTAESISDTTPAATTLSLTSTITDIVTMETTMGHHSTVKTSPETVSTARETASATTAEDVTDSQTVASTVVSSDPTRAMEMLPGCYIVTSGGNSGGAICVLPFVYMETLYYECTTIDRGSSWCSTTPDFDADGMWGLCQEVVCPATPTPGTTAPTTAPQPVCYTPTVEGNSDGANCSLPFIYRTAVYYECTVVNDARFWCATTANYDVDGAWGYCLAEICTPTLAPDIPTSPSTQPLSTNPVPSDLTSLKTDISSTGTMISAMSSSLSSQHQSTPFSTDPVSMETASTFSPDLSTITSEFMSVSTEDILETRGTTEGTRSADYTGSTPLDATKTTEDTAQDSTASFTALPPNCYITTFGGSGEGENCVLPFLHDGVVYHNCTLVDTLPGDAAWCGTVYDVDTYRLWGYCRMLICLDGGTTMAEDMLVTAEVTSSGTEIPDGRTASGFTAVSPETTAPPFTALPANCYIPTTGASGNGANCVFPFLYGGKMYYNCTLDNSTPDLGAWCGTNFDVDTFRRWGYCLDVVCISETETSQGTVTDVTSSASSGTSTLAPDVSSGTAQTGASTGMTDASTEYATLPPGCVILTSGGSAQGAPCVFPFLSLGETYTACTMVNNLDGVPWCGTTADVDRDRLWGNCGANNCTLTSAESSVPTTPEVPTSTAMDSTSADTATSATDLTSGAPATVTDVTGTVETTETQPTTVVDGTLGTNTASQTPPTTSTTTDDTPTLSTEPGGPECIILTTGGTAHASACVFPFDYQDVTYTECTLTAHTVPWCATSRNFTADNLWGECAADCYNATNCTIVTIEGTSPPGTPCEFPYWYRGELFYGCTTYLFGETLWCGTTGDVDADSLWGTCGDDICGTTIAMTGTAQSTTPDYETGSATSFTGSTEFLSTNPSDKVTDTTASVTGISASTISSVTVDTGATSVSEGTAVPSTALPPGCYIPTEGGFGGGPPCVFPFMFLEVLYHECITDNYGRMWCGVTGSYDFDRMWGFCLDVTCNATEQTASTNTVSMATQTDATGSTQSPLDSSSSSSVSDATVISSSSPTDVTTGPTDVTTGLTDVTMGPTDVTTGPTDVSMGSTTVDPTCYTPVFDGTVGLGVCDFPFIYNTEFYYECITLDRDQLWCATTPNVDVDDLWGYCQDEICPRTPMPQTSTETFLSPTTSTAPLPCYTPTSGGSGEGANCSFPFLYRGVVYMDCIEGVDGVPWCSVTTLFDEDRLYGYCQDEVCPGTASIATSPSVGTQPTVSSQTGETTLSSFITTAGPESTGSMATTSVGDATVEQSSSLPESTGSVATASASDATVEQSSSRPTAPVVTTPTPPNNCIYPAVATTGGNGGGADCAFPYEYRGEMYTECITTGWNNPWCPTTSTYDEDMIWGDCVVLTEEGEQCVFPFMYNGGRYLECSEQGREDARPWCATVMVLSGSGTEWGYCEVQTVVCPSVTEATASNATSGTDVTSGTVVTSEAMTSETSTVSSEGCPYPSVLTFGGNAGNAYCVFPYVYNSISYVECISTAWTQPWCATTPNYDLHQVWGNCLVYTVSGEMCVFPFMYEGIEFRECTDVGRAANRKWCATVEDLGTGSDQWGYCDIREPLCPITSETASLGDVTSQSTYGDVSNTPSDVESTVGVTISSSASAVTSSSPPVPDCSNPIVETASGNSNGGPCVFPFLYEGALISECIDVRWSRPWCATTDNYDEDKLWADCVIYTTSGIPCEFPFRYNEDQLASCPPADNIRPEGPWCATSVDLNTGSMEWGYCFLPWLCGVTTPIDQTPGPTVSGQTGGGSTLSVTIGTASTDETSSISPSDVTASGTSPLGTVTAASSGDVTMSGITTSEQATTADVSQGVSAGVTSEGVYSSSGGPLEGCYTPTTGGNGGGLPCIFPFTKDGETHDACTVGDRDMPWCSVTSDFERDNLWGFCLDIVCGVTPTLLLGTPTMPGNYNCTDAIIETRDGTDPDGPCVTPFLYRGEMREGCISDSWDKPWCATTADYDTDKRWADCIIYTQNGDLCNFPFLYAGVQFTGCTTDGSSEGAWCGLVSTLPIGSAEWGYCFLVWEVCPVDITTDTETPSGVQSTASAPATSDVPSQSSVSMASGATASDVPSQSSASMASGATASDVPSQSSGSMASGGTTSDGTTSDGGTSVGEGGTSSGADATVPTLRPTLPIFPVVTTPSRAPDDVTISCDGAVQQTSGGNGNDEPCAFPFTYNEISYYECVSTNHHRPWCGTTVDYDTDMLWGNCLIVTTGGVPCNFPFRYNDQWYNGCTPDGDMGGDLWCGIVDVLPANSDQWGYCYLLWEVCPLTQQTTAIPTSAELDTTVGLTSGSDTTGPGLPDTTTAQVPAETTAYSCEGAQVETSGGTGGGAPCIFPYVYRSTMYYECIMTNHDQPWCATTVQYDDDELWGNCLIKTKESDPCVFPFVYNGQTYAECTLDGNRGGGPWCATVEQLDADPAQWGFCFLLWDECPPTDALPTSDPCYTLTNGGTADDGSRCMFPFTWDGGTFMRCTGIGRDIAWCSVTSDYDADGLWGYCGEIVCEGDVTRDPEPGTAGTMACVISTIGGSSPEGSMCVFPFVWDGGTFHECTRIGRNAPWCGTTADYDADLLWGYCQQTSCLDFTTPAVLPPSACTTSRGNNAEGAMCAFPFIFQGRSYSQCIRTPERNSHWCSLVPNYDDVPLWGYCTGENCVITDPVTDPPPTEGDNCRTSPGNNNAGVPCSFPFIFEGQTYDGCITLIRGQPWCSLVPNYDENTVWGFCDANCPLADLSFTSPAPTTCRTSPGNNNAGVPCSFPFIFEGQSYDGCIIAIRGQPWCSLLPNYDVDPVWGFCDANCPLADLSFTSPAPTTCRTSPGNNNAGVPCSFPFIFEGQSYDGCINTNRGQPWCSLLPNYDVDAVWGFCDANCPLVELSFTSPAPDTCRTSPGNNNAGVPCSLPFIFEGQSYDGCISDIRGQPWCSLVPNYDVDTVWGFCDDNCPLAATSITNPVPPGCYIRTTGGNNIEGALCALPFTTGGIVYRQCVEFDRDRPWCSLTYNYDVDVLWAYCDEVTCTATATNPPTPTTVLPTAVLPSVCTVDFFVRLSNTVSFNGVEQAGLTTVILCQQRCLSTPWCKALDFHSNSRGCYLHDESSVALADVGAEGVDQYRRVPCNQQFCLDSFTTTENILSPYGVHIGQRDLVTCQLACLAAPWCAAVDYAIPSYDCTLHTLEELQNIQTSEGANNQYRRENCDSVVAPTDSGCTPSFEMVPNTLSAGGDQLHTANTLQLCQLGCIGTAWCHALDFNTNINGCFLHDADYLETVRGGVLVVNQYRITRC